MIKTVSCRARAALEKLAQTISDWTAPVNVEICEK